MNSRPTFLLLAALVGVAQAQPSDGQEMTPEDRAAMERINSQFEGEGGDAADDQAGATAKVRARNARKARQAYREVRDEAKYAASLGWECRSLLEGGGSDLSPCDAFSQASRGLSRSGDQLLRALDAEGASESDLPDGAMDKLNSYMESVRETQSAIQRMAAGR